MNRLLIDIVTGYRLDGSSIIEKKYLDLFTDGEVKTEFTYDIADVNSVSSRNSSYSYDFQIPINDHNSEIFKYIDNLSSKESFDVKKQIKSYYFQDEILIFDGFLQYKELILNKEKGTKVFSIIIYGDNDIIYNRLNNKTLGDSDFSALNFTYSAANVLENWGVGPQGEKPPGFPYRFGLIDRGWNWNISDINWSYGDSVTQSSVNLRELSMVVNKKAIFDKIMQDAGIHYTSTDLNSDDFKDQYVLFNTVPKVPIKEALKTSFDYYNDLHVSDPSDGSYQTYQQDMPLYYEYNDFILEEGGYTIFQNLISDSISIDFNFSGKFYCVPDQHDNVIQQATMENPIGLYFPGLGLANFSIYFRFKRIIEKWNGFAWITLADEILYAHVPGIGMIQNFGWAVHNTVYHNKNFVFSIAPGEKLRFSVAYQHVQPPWHTGPLFTCSLQTRINGNFTFSDLYDGVIIDYNSLVDSKLKQLDFISSIIKQRNLMIVPVKNATGHFIIEPRDIYYQSGIVKDWTDKLDLSKDIIEKSIIKDIRTFEFTDKPDKDYWNTKYSDEFQEVYGSLKYDTENEHIDKVEKIEVIFSPTPLKNVTDSYQFIISSITKDKDQNDNEVFPPKGWTDFNVRDFYWNKIPFNNGQDTFSFNGGFYDFIPYLGHQSNPYDPNRSNDLNWGPTRDVFYVNQGISQNGLFARFWESTIKELTDTDSKLVTAYFHLTSEDIYNFEWNDKIFLRFDEGGQYYRFNKIIQYDPNSGRSTKVELIKSKYINIPPKRNVKKPTKPIKPTIEKIYQSNQTQLKNFDDGINNEFYGRGNKSHSDTYGNKFYGNFSTIGTSSNKNIITGDGVIIGTGSNSNHIIGSNVIVGSGVENSYIIGDNIIATQSNQFYAYKAKIENHIEIKPGATPSTTSDTIIFSDESGKLKVYEEGNYKDLVSKLEYSPTSKLFNYNDDVNDRQVKLNEHFFDFSMNTPTYAGPTAGTASWSGSEDVAINYHFLNGDKNAIGPTYGFCGYLEFNTLYKIDISFYLGFDNWNGSAWVNSVNGPPNGSILTIRGDSSDIQYSIKLVESLSSLNSNKYVFYPSDSEFITIGTQPSPFFTSLEPRYINLEILLKGNAYSSLNTLKFNLYNNAESVLYRYKLSEFKYFIQNFGPYQLPYWVLNNPY